MLKARPTPFGRWFWQLFCRISIRMYFRGPVWEMPQVPDSQKSLLMVGNHVSWWDGFWMIRLNEMLFKREYYVMMLEEQLSPRPFMQQGGAFSIDPGSRSIVESLSYTAELLKNPRNLVQMYPQGEIHSVYHDQFVFSPGIERILKKAGDQTQLYFFAALLDYFSEPKPLLRFYIEPYDHLSQASDSQSLEQAYRAFYKSCTARQKA
ncbi:MAG: glycerol acyltransferase [Bacteroidetes bacterium]|nr:MAG: glycerol acyltransferase [Bacteroidota bacterium]